MNKKVVSRDLLTVTYTCMYYVYVDNYCNITCWLLFQLCFARVYIRVSTKQIKKNLGSKPKITETGSVLRLFRFIFETNEIFVSVCFGLFRCFECILKN